MFSLNISERCHFPFLTWIWKNIVYSACKESGFFQTRKCRQPDWLVICKCRRGSADTLLGILKCRRGSADRGWLFLSADAKVQTLVLSLSSLDYAHISSSDTFRFWNWALASSKTQSDKPEVTLLSKNDEDKIIIVLIVTPQPNRINIFGKSKATNGLGTSMGSQVSKRCVEVRKVEQKALR